jgi:hypothetical protein
MVLASAVAFACAPVRPPNSPERAGAAPPPATGATGTTGATRAVLAEPPELLGRWELQGDPPRRVELRPGGTGTIDGYPLTWSVDGDRLTITDPGGTDTTGWRVEGDRLLLAGPFDSQLVLVRVR